jgi:hypothetical protein
VDFTNLLLLSLSLLREGLLDNLGIRPYNERPKRLQQQPIIPDLSSNLRSFINVSGNPKRCR